MARGQSKTDALVDFIYSSVPAEVREIYSVMMELDYPIADALAYKSTVEAATQGKPSEVRNLLIDAFTASSFPILSPQNGLEKLNEVLPAHLRLVPISHGGPHLGLRPQPLLPPLALQPSWVQESFRRLLALWACQGGCDDALSRCLERAGGEAETLQCHTQCVDCRRSCASA